MILSMMAASSRNGAIGKRRDGKDGLPWSRLPADLKAFKEHTTGKPVIMGSTTWKSIDEKPLPNRSNIVISRTLPERADAVVVRSFDAAVVAARACGTDVAEAVVVGGAVVYGEALPRADRILLTIVDADLDGDAHFPVLDDDWWCLPPRFVAADAKHAHALRFYDLWRKPHAPPDAQRFSWNRSTGVTAPRE